MEPALGFIFVYVIVLILYRTGIEVTLCLCSLFPAAFIAAYRIFKAFRKEYPAADLTGAEIEAPFRKPLI